MSKSVEKKNKRLALLLIILVLIAAAGAIAWFTMYAPLLTGG